MPPDRGLMDKPSSGTKGNKKRLTYAFTANADGSEKLPPFVIGKAAKPRAFQKKSGADLGFYYRNNAKAWMTSKIYQEWLRGWDEKLRREGRHILLLQDNFSAHINPDDLTNVRVKNFKPNLTAHVQPNDSGIIRCFKAHFHGKFISRAIDQYDNDSDIPTALIYEINQLEAMRLADAAWSEVDTTTIRNCWKKTGILPEALNYKAKTPTPTVSISYLLNSDSMVTSSLDQLETRGILQKRNRMKLEEFLNPYQNKR